MTMPIPSPPGLERDVRRLSCKLNRLGRALAETSGLNRLTEILNTLGEREETNDRTTNPTV